jgi:hypothetical protein
MLHTACCKCLLAVFLPCSHQVPHSCPCVHAARPPAPAWPRSALCLPQAVPKTDRAAAPIFAVIDAPGKTVKDKGYLWIEVRLRFGEWPSACLPGGLVVPAQSRLSNYCSCSISTLAVLPAAEGQHAAAPATCPH